MDERIRSLEKQGRIRAQKAGFAQIEGLLLEAMRELREARTIVDIAERATYLLAYMAMLKAGRALMLLNGYIPADGGQHKTVVEMTGMMLGGKYRHLTQQFERMRRKRNEMTYEAGSLLSKSDAHEAFEDAIAIVQRICAEVTRLNPQQELKFHLDGE